MQIFEYCKACKARVKPHKDNPNKWSVCLLPDSHRALRRHVWSADYQLGGKHGKRLRPKFKFGITKEEATAKVYEHITDFNRGTFIPTDKGKIPFKDHIEKYDVEHIQENSQHPNGSVKYYLKDIKARLGGLAIGIITAEILEQARSKFKADVGASNAHANRWFSVCKTILNRAVKRGYIHKNPADEIEPLETTPTTPRFWTDAQIKEFQATPTYQANQNLDDYSIALLNTGMRPINLKNLRWMQIDLENEWMSYVSHKGRKPRPLSRPIPGPLLAVFKRRFKETGGNGPVLDITNLRKLIDAAMLESKVNEGRPENEKLTIYGFKHTYISNMLMKGTDISTVSELTGVSEATIRKHYAKFTKEHLREAQANVVYQSQIKPALTPELKVI